ncbi:hypothetical protein OTB20_03770 [Streptomyces sp. H27-H1]|uniref:hypothetical protein n=1 Tax=Streptomyces sp. H27-H1 TaxID=2996461 RepID=UPI00226DCA79|nr:hypothetical protein [Streptomyces sp. H27-H1]MCY0925337.1 hypothetical protein [Streptomyces sp. H27-H1]
MTAAEPEHVAWLAERQLARAWPTIRATCLYATANANGVRNNLHASRSTWGETKWRTYHPADVARVAGAIADGTAELQPRAGHLATLAIGRFDLCGSRAGRSAHCRTPGWRETAYGRIEST